MKLPAPVPALSLVLVAFLAGPASPQPVTLDDLRDVPTMPWVAVSPDGGTVAYLLREAEAEGPDLWAVPTAGGEPGRLTRGGGVAAVAGSGPPRRGGWRISVGSRTGGRC